ncbi:MAG: GreA/GreB family elongation factor [Puniceicoccales bacterium]|nr:GreA/GreB family elongation factor [Puniceicoccales bacterium]
MNSKDIENILDASPALRDSRAKLEAMKDGAYCRHRSWGFGQIKKYDPQTNRLVIDFPDFGKLAHAMAPEFCVKNLEVFPESHIFVTQQKDPAAFATRLKKDATGLVKEILAAATPDKEGRLRTSAHELEETLTHLVGAERFKKWWAPVKKQLVQDPDVAVPEKKDGYYELRDDPVNPEQEILDEYYLNRNPLRKIKLAEELFESLLGELDEAEGTPDDGARDGIAGVGEPKPKAKPKAKAKPVRNTQLIEKDLQNIFDELTKVIRSVRRIDTTTKPTDDEFVKEAREQAARLRGIWVRNDLCRHLKADVETLEPTSKSIILAADEKMLSGIAAEIPQTPAYLKRLLDLITRVYPEPEKWQDVCITLLRDSTGKFTAECVNFLVERECAGLVARHLLEWLNTQALKSPVLSWIVKNRSSKKYAKIVRPLINHRLLSAILYAIDNEALQSSSTRRIPLAEELSDERELIAELLEEADNEIARDLAKTLLLNQGFEPLTKKSLIARFIRLYPGIQSLVTGDASEQVEQLIVSQWSLDARRAELKELIEKKIPENKDAIARAKEHGDLSENSEYKMARQDQETLLARKAQLERDLTHGRVTDFSDAPTDTVGIGSVVEVTPASGKPVKYTILGAWDSDPDKNILSYKTPLASKLFGKRVGESAQTEVDGVTETWTVRSIARWADQKH